MILCACLHSNWRYPAAVGKTSRPYPTTEGLWHDDHNEARHKTWRFGGKALLKIVHCSSRGKTIEMGISYDSCDDMSDAMTCEAIITAEAQTRQM